MVREVVKRRGGRSRWARMVLCSVLLAAMPAALGVARAADDPSSAALAPLIAQLLLDPVPPNIDGTRLDVPALRALYDARSSAPLWVTQSDADARIAAVLAVLRAADREGLDPQAYRVSAIEARRSATDPRARAELDLLLSEAVMHYGVHVRTGARRPRVPIPDVTPAVVDPDPLPIALNVAAASPGGVAAYMQTLPPQNADYRALREALASYRELAARGGWPVVPDGPKLTPGAVDPSVRGLRARLIATGELAEPARVSPAQRDVYDKALEAAVKRFQRRHGLSPDGTVGTRTRAALNVTAAERVDQLVANLERRRWLPDDFGERYVWINIPDYTLRVEDHGTTMLEMPVVVGKSSWPTPVFSSEIRHVTFNPPWNVPPRIASEELFPKAMADDGFFAAQGIEVRGGTRVASAGSGISDADRSPRRLRQAPGPKNPLGRVKFNMPNPYGVYLHDTPNKDKFRLGVRSLSHGCVRVGNAPALAAALLGDMPEWSEERRKDAFSTWSTRSVNLRSPIPVHIVYKTAWQDPDGDVEFREDIYDSDPQLVKDLAKPRSIRPLTPGDVVQGEPTTPIAVAAP